MSASQTKWQMIEFPFFSDARGETIPFELDKKFPFPVKRVYVVTGTKDGSRGGHAHKCEEEVFVAVSGAVTAIVNDGSGDKKIVINKKYKGLLVRSGCWHEFRNFSSDAVLLAFSSTHFEGRGGYIEDKEKFLSGKTFIRIK